MARIFIDGFEAGEHDMWDAENNATVVSSAGLDMDGDYCLDLAASFEYLQKNITATDEMYFAFLYRPVANIHHLNVVSMPNNATDMVQVLRHKDTLKLYTFRGTTLLGIGTHNINNNTTYLIEVHVKIADTGGILDVKVDGVSDSTFSGDTKIGADTQFNRVNLGEWNTANGARGSAYYDNFIMDDAAWIGNTKIQKILPTGAGNATNWIPSAGANWQCVDECPPSDVDYVSINAVDTVDTYAAGNMAGSIDSVKCVQIQSRTESDGAPTPTNLKLAVKSGVTTYLSGDKSVPAAPKGLWNLWETNPADSAAWEETDVNAMEIGIKSAA